VIHQYQNNGYHIVLDVNSGSVHVVDKIAYDVIGCLEAMNPAHTPETLKEEKTAEYLLEKLGDIYAFERSSGGSGRADSGRSVVYTGCL